ncbi:hypothetical protein [Streptomyces sp. NPDC053560]|uniref:DUF7691 family protein n=1 Tax=Streptomyces sp. NPDC053560 TaxID=3365711 RepID=UPI0037CF06BF
MSHNISFSTADKHDVAAFIGNRDLTSEQQRLLRLMQERAWAQQDDLDRQGVDWGLPIPVALDHLIAGRADAEGRCAGNAYRTALQLVIDHNASDPDHLGTFSKPATFFSLLDEELQRLGVPAELLPYGFLYAGPPPEIPLSLPCSLDGYPEIGYLPLEKAGPAADAYTAVLDRLDPDFAYDLKVLIEKLRFEDENWREASARLDWYTQDTIFFSLT